MSVEPSLVADMETWDHKDLKKSNDHGKRRCMHFPVRDKLKHIKRLERGESAKVIAHELGLSPATVRRWRTHRHEFTKVDEHCKRVRMGANPRLDEAVYIWFQERRAEGVTISSKILKGKATELNEKMGGDTKFNASDGWLARWRYRHGIKREMWENDKLPIHFEEKFFEILESEMNLTSSQVFNVAVTTLNWKLLPLKAMSAGRVSLSTNHDRVTIMTCSNADSTLKLRLLVIGKSAQPRGLKNVQQLAIPVCYANQENAALDSQIFGDWFINEFVPRVSQFFIEKKMPLRAILLLDRTDPISSDLAIGGIKTMLVPADEKLSVTTLKYNITKDLKRRYRQGLLELASDAQDKGHDPIQHVKILGMKDIIFRLDNAWLEVSPQTIVESWNNLMTPLETIESDPLAIEDLSEANIIFNLLRKIAGNVDITEKEVDDWINDSETQLSTGKNSERIEPVKHEDTEDRKVKDIVEDNDVITPMQAVEALDSVIQFFESHGQLSAIELEALRKAREVASAMRIK